MHSLIKVLVSVFLLVSMVTLAAGEDKCAPIHELKTLGLIMDVRSDGYEIYVSKKWYSLPLSTKEAIALGMLECLNPKGKHIRIHDGYSGKQIGRYGQTFGYSSSE